MLFKLFTLASLASVAVAQLLFPTGYFFITSVSSDLVLDVRGNSKKVRHFEPNVINLKPQYLTRQK